MLRGPRTNTHGTRRLSRKLGDAQEHHEAVLNYRRDGTPFMNLLMVTPLFDTQGKTRYFLGSQIDVSGLLDDEETCTYHPPVAPIFRASRD